MRVTKTDDLEKLFYSKYIQSRIFDTYISVKRDLENKNKVLFVGTPCQIDALKMFVGDSEYLFTLDLVCYGVGSTYLFYDYLSKKEHEHESKVNSIIFRKKIIGEHNGYTIVKYENNKKTKEIFFLSEFGIPFTKRLTHRKSCFTCKYSSLDRRGDISIGDYRASNKIQIDPFNLKKGVSLIKVNTSKGADLLNLLIESNNIVTKPIYFDDIKHNLNRMNKENDIEIFNKRNEAMQVYTNGNYEEFVRKYCITNKEHKTRLKHSFIREIIKFFLKRSRFYK